MNNYEDKKQTRQKKWKKGIGDLDEMRVDREEGRKKILMKYD